jgi:glycosyltransferase involved in cell wall biosynthesis
MFEPPRTGITALIPCFNEVECIDRVYREVTDALDGYEAHEILFVDDGSTDGTLAHIKRFAEADPHVHYVSFTRNFGQEAALSAGYAYAAMPWTVQLDADLQWPPSQIDRLVTAYAGCDVVFGVRAARRDTWLRRLGGTAHQSIARRWFGIEVPPGASAFRLVRTSVGRKVVEARLGTPYFLATVPLLGAAYTTVPVEHHERQGGSGKWSAWKLLAHAGDLFVGFSFRPLALAYLLGLLGLVGLAAAALLAASGATGATGVALIAAAIAAAGTVSGALLARYLVRVLRSQPRLPQFQIREANVPVRPADSLYEYECEYRHGTARAATVP